MPTTGRRKLLISYGETNNGARMHEAVAESKCRYQCLGTRLTHDVIRHWASYYVPKGNQSLLDVVPNCCASLEFDKGFEKVRGGAPWESSKEGWMQINNYAKEVQGTFYISRESSNEYPSSLLAVARVKQVHCEADVAITHSIEF